MASETTRDLTKKIDDALLNGRNATQANAAWRQIKARLSIYEDSILAAGDLIEQREQPIDGPSLDYLSEGFWGVCDDLRRQNPGHR